MVRKAAGPFSPNAGAFARTPAAHLELHGLDEGIVAADREGNTLLFNSRAARILGTNERQLNPQTWARDFGVFTPIRSQNGAAACDRLLCAIAGERVEEKSRRG